MDKGSNSSGEGTGALELTERFYAELRDIARRLLRSERGGHSLQPTSLVHEAYLRLAAGNLPPGSRSEHLALAAHVLRQVLVDHHRARGALKRGGGHLRVALAADLEGERHSEHEFEALEAALARLRDLHPRQAEVVILRAYGGLSMEEVAARLGVSKRTAEGDWAVARAWLARELSRHDPERK